MQIRDVMTCNIAAVGPDATLTEAAQKMKARDVGSVAVCDGERLAGIITDRDITVRAIAEGHDPQTTTVREVMTNHVVCTADDQSVDEAARLMEDRRVRRLPVLDRDRQLVGMVSLGDLAVGTGDPQLAGDVLKRVSEP